MLVGIFCGLAAAFSQSLSYIASRNFMQRRLNGGAAASLQMIILAHLWMAAFSILILPFVWSSALRWQTVLLPLGGAVLTSVLGQVGLLISVRYAEPSRVSPLLTIKLFVPALLTSFVGSPVGQVTDRWLTAWQWVAVLLCVTAGVALNFTGGRMRRVAVVAVLSTAFVFALSDWCVGTTVGMVLKTPGITSLQASLLSEALLYLTSGMVLLPLISVWGPRDRRDWRDSFPYGLTWFVAMIFLFFAFSQIGVVLGTILQCTRGFMTIVIGTTLMYLGYTQIEPRQPRSVVVRRLCAGLLMFLAISLYVIRDPLPFIMKSSTTGSRGIADERARIIALHEHHR